MRPEKPKVPKKIIDVNHVCSHLTWLFNNAISSMGRDWQKGTKLYQYQIDFCYYIDDIRRGPTYLVPKNIADCNELINGITESSKKDKS